MADRVHQVRLAEARAAVRAYDWATVARDVVRVYETVAGDTAVVETQAGPA